MFCDVECPNSPCHHVYCREIFRLLDIMHVDMANFTISQMRPYLKEQSVTYERTKFEEFIVQQEGKYW